MITAGLLVAIFTLSYFVAPAQEQKHTGPKWISQKGYWVVEGNVKTPLTNTIRFYDNDDELLYTEKLDGVKLNINRRKVRMKLKQVLESAILVKAGKEESAAGMALVKSIL